MVFLISAIQATGLLAITLTGLSPAEHICLIWTHIQAGKKDAAILKFKDKGAELTVFAVESRYPEFSEPLLSDTEDVLKIAEEFMVYVNERIKI